MPAYDTKHLSLLTCHVDGSTYILHQDNASCETGSTLWLSAQVLIAYLLGRRPRRRSARRERVLELGSGIGLTALALRQILHAHVVASDCAAILPLLTRNISENRVRAVGSQEAEIEVKEIDWFKQQVSPSEDFDLIVMSDVIYSPDLLAPLLNTILTFMSKKTTLYLAQEVRVATLLDRFLEMCSLHMKVTQISDHEIESMIRERFTARNITEDEMSGNAKDWSGVAIYKMKLKPITTRETPHRKNPIPP